jgi:pilus assembly protein Flp/PilA
MLALQKELLMAAVVSRFMKDESGATAIEYGLIAALIATALITGATTLGNALNNQFNGLAGQLNLS